MTQEAVDSPWRLAEGTRVGRYRVLRHLGAGGMADVYEAEHVGLSKRVALKVLRPELAARPDVRRRFLDEGTIASRIQHPNVVSVTDVGDTGSNVYLVMELLSGMSLQTLLEAHLRMTVSQITDLMLPILVALGEAHTEGVVHQDVKPDNILLAKTRRGRLVPKLVDFGISTLAELEAARESAQSSVLGTPHYMAPERARGEQNIDARADQFSAAMILYEAVAGALPYRAQSVLGIVREAAEGELLPLSALVPDIPPELEAIVMRALSSDPADRYEDIESFAKALLPFASASGKRAFAAATEAAAGGTLSEPPISDPSISTPRLSIPRPGRLPDGVEAKETAPMPVASSAPPAPVVTLPVKTSETPARRRGPWIVGAALSVVVLGAVLVWGLSEDPEPDPVAAPPAASSERPATAPTAAPRGPFEVPLPARRAHFHVALMVQPEDATIRLDDQEPVVGQLELDLLRDGTPHRLVVEAPGYISHEVSFVNAPPPPKIVLNRLPRGRSARRTASAMTVVVAPTEPPPATTETSPASSGGADESAPSSPTDPAPESPAQPE